MKTKTSHQTVLSPMLVSVVFLLILTNLLVIDYIVVKNQTNPSYVLGDATTSAASQCPQACLAAINRITGIATAKEYFVPLGAGTNATDDWADVPGAQASVDTTQYPRIKKVVFEANIQVPTGNQVAYARLFNVTDQHPVWFSEVSMNTTGPVLLTAPVTLDRGNKLYQVQMKTQLKFTANLTQSRLRITTY